MDLPFYREYDLPWTTDRGQERKFQRLLGSIFLGVAVLGLVWPFIPTPEPDPYEVEEIPPRIAQLLLEEKPLPPPPPPKVEEEPEPSLSRRKNRNRWSRTNPSLNRLSSPNLSP